MPLKTGKKLQLIVKPLHGGHRRDLKVVSVIETRTLHRGSSQIGLCYFKNLLWGVWVLCNRPQSVPKGRCWEKKGSKDNILENIFV